MTKAIYSVCILASMLSLTVSADHLSDYRETKAKLSEVKKKLIPLHRDNDRRGLDELKYKELKAEYNVLVAELKRLKPLARAQAKKQKAEEETRKKKEEALVKAVTALAAEETKEKERREKEAAKKATEKKRRVLNFAFAETIAPSKRGINLDGQMERLTLMRNAKEQGMLFKIENPDHRLRVYITPKFLKAGIAKQTQLMSAIFVYYYPQKDNDNTRIYIRDMADNKVGFYLLSRGGLVFLDD